MFCSTCFLATEEHSLDVSSVAYDIVFIPEITKSHLGATTLVNIDHPTEQARIIASIASLLYLHCIRYICIMSNNSHQHSINES